MNRRQYNSVLIQKMLEDQDSPVREQIHNNHSHKQYKQQTIPQDPQLRMIVDIGDGRKDSIQISRHDDPSILARKFCFEHNLDPKVIAVLTKNLRSFMNSTYNNPIVNSIASSEQLSVLEDQHALNTSQPKKMHYVGSNMMRRSSKRLNKNNNRPNEDSRINDSSSSVFDRLYHSRAKKIPNSSSSRDQTAAQINSSCNNINRSSLTASMIQQENSNPNQSMGLINSGVMIYERNRRITEASRKKIERRIQQLKQEQEHANTFHPEINEISRLMVEKMRELEPGDSIQARNSRLKQEKLAKLKREQEKKELEGCTFRPQTNSRKQEASSQCHQSVSTDRFTDLYNDSMDRALKSRKAREAAKNKHNFQPAINPLSSILVNEKFEDRLRRYECEKMLRAEKTKRQIDDHPMLQSSSSSRSFHPKTGRAPENRNKEGLPVGLYLYNNRYEKEKALLRVLEEEQRQLLRNRSITNPNSSKIYETSKADSIVDLFRVLDSDGDGVISTRKVNVADVRQDVLKIIAPVLNEMEELEAQLTESDFTQAILRLFKVSQLTQSFFNFDQTLNVHQKNTILRHSSGDLEIPECAFRPSLNEKSLEMARNKRPQSSSSKPGVSLYEVCQMRKSQQELQIKKQKRLRELAEMQECTFQPRTMRGNSRF